MSVLRRRVGARWAGFAVAALVMSAAMVVLGNWQWDRYQDRRARNARVEASATTEPVPLREVLPRPATPGEVGTAPTQDKEWTSVTVIGRYDSRREILGRQRTVNGKVGFEVLTPLLLADDTAVVVSRGWIAAPANDALARPALPPTPTGPVTVTGSLHRSESGAQPLQRYRGRIEVRRISLGQLAEELPYPVHGGYVRLTQQAPAADDALVPIPVRAENAWQSGAYAVQWWVFAAATIGWYVWAILRARPATRRRPVTDGATGCSTSAESGAAA